MLAIFVTLAQLSVCQKPQNVVPYDDYDVIEENGGEDPGGEYDCEYDAMSMLANLVTLAQLSVCQKQQ
jgi:hypothetical protein